MERSVVVAASEGLHARPAAVFVKAAAAAKSPVKVGLAGADKRVSATSILAVMGLGVESGSTVVLESDDSAALDTLEKILTDSSL
ncbi:MAG: HPr family phosphocarrier protein [Propionibacteriaceae bacterium]|jgi:phosphocarrier protein|nr:HPr family phosphocarrier protein [Propionibacteriaceae bacterium]